MRLRLLLKIWVQTKVVQGRIEVVQWFKAPMYGANCLKSGVTAAGPVRNGDPENPQCEHAHCGFSDHLSRRLRSHSGFWGLGHSAKKLTRSRVVSRAPGWGCQALLRTHTRFGSGRHNRTSEGPLATHQNWGAVEPVRTRRRKFGARRRSTRRNASELMRGLPASNHVLSA